MKVKTFCAPFLPLSFIRWTADDPTWSRIDRGSKICHHGSWILDFFFWPSRSEES